VAVFDGDLNGPCQAQLAGLEVRPWIPTEQGLLMPRSAEGIGVVSMGSLLPTAQAMDFESVATGEEQTWRGTREFAMLAQLLGAVHWGTLDFLLFDLPPGPERTRQFAQFLSTHAATALVLVTIPSDLSRGVVARSIAALEESGGNLLGLVENMVGYYCRDCGAVRPLFPPSDIPLPIERLGAIPFDPHLAASSPEGAVEEATSEHHSHNNSQREISEIARRIVRRLRSET